MTGNCGDIIVLPMTEEDLDGVLAIEASSFPLPWNRGHFLAEIASPHSFPLVAMSGSSVAGFVCPSVIVDEGHILDVAVHDAFRRRGLGRVLVEAALRECRARGAEFVDLEVRVSNEAAIGLYRILGFRETGIRRRYYENGEDALLMEYTFEEVT